MIYNADAGRYLVLLKLLETISTSKEAYRLVQLNYLTNLIIVFLSCIFQPRTDMQLKSNWPYKTSTVFTEMIDVLGGQYRDLYMLAN